MRFFWLFCVIFAVGCIGGEVATGGDFSDAGTGGSMGGTAGGSTLVLPGSGGGMGSGGVDTSSGGGMGSGGVEDGAGGAVEALVDILPGEWALTMQFTSVNCSYPDIAYDPQDAITFDVLITDDLRLFQQLPDGTEDLWLDPGTISGDVWVPDTSPTRHKWRNLSLSSTDPDHLTGDGDKYAPCGLSGTWELELTRR